MPAKKPLPVLLAVLLLMLVAWLFPASIAVADEFPEPESETISPWRLGVALGYGQRTNPLKYSDNITVIVDLDIAWFGEHWFFDNGDVGYTLTENDLFTVNLVGRINSDRVFFAKTNTQFISIENNVGQIEQVEAEIPDRDYAIEAGVELLADGEWGYLQAGAFQDVSRKHKGSEIYAEYSYLFRHQRWFFEPSAGFSWKSQKLNDYYWGVTEDEASLAFPAYDAGAGVNVFARLKVSYQLTRKWSTLFVAEYERLNHDAANSPLVDDKSAYGAFAGFKYNY
ncbi:MAG TPA: MipA/OmpV family protein [Xanthomonadales bacterium]|nr:MipA/OmpV family protein [Xanthomonadales bacterium]